MKKTYSNSDIITIYNVLNNIKSRADIVPGDAEIFWANSINLKVFRENATMIQDTINELVQSYFTDENSHIDGENRVLNDDVKDEILKEIDTEVDKIYKKTMEINVETIPEESLKSMIKANEKTMSFLEMTVMRQFINDDTETTE